MIQSSFQSQYGIRLSKDLEGMKWNEFKALLIGISPETALGRIVAIRAEDDKEVLKRFSKEQHKIRNKWRRRRAVHVSDEEMQDMLERLKNTFINMSK